MTRKIIYTDEPLGDIEVVADFLPSPAELAFREEGFFAVLVKGKPKTNVVDRNQLITVVALSPSVVGTVDLATFESLVLTSGEVSAKTLSKLIPVALSLAFAKIDDDVVAVAALKRPNQSYRTKVFTKAKSTSNPANYQFELGWVFVSPAARGKRLASKLVETLVCSLNGASAYATSRVDNEYMHSALARCAFHPVGNSYTSQLNEPEIQLFIRE
jgi:predicted GNAT family N-acyltransferase